MNNHDYVQNAIKTESVPESVNIEIQPFDAMMQFAVMASKIMNAMKRQLFYNKPPNAEEFSGFVDSAIMAVEFLESQVQSKLLTDPGALKAWMEARNIELAPEVAEAIDRRKNATNIRLLHAAIGIFTESGELLEALVEAAETGTLDKVNFAEEIGDVQWYAAIASDETGVSLDAIQKTNIAKLKKRYPQKFDAELAVNRDVKGERAILEGAVK